jgi:alkanesulfonate monooxygenase SsuD/methylene tetrahydromethanopterin reductase-like flavin-dependent oxidoreductase (luciferase family)
MELIVGPYGMQSPHPYRRPHQDLYEDLIEHARRIEALGFDGIGLTEHSFWYDGYCPALLPVLAVLAQHTTRLKLMTAALLLPQHDPLKVAEEAAVVDRLSNGRLILGLGVGYRPEEFLGHGVPEGRWGARFLEAYEVVRRALTGERFSFEGEFYRYRDVAIGTRPIQDPVPMWACAGYAEWSAKALGRRGWAYCTTGDLAGGGSVFDLYEQSATAAGRPRAGLRRGLFKDVLVMPTEREAEVLKEQDYWPAMNDQFLGFGFFKQKNPDGSQMTEMPIEMKEEFFRNPNRPIGSPAQVRPLMERVRGLDLDLMLIRLIWANFRQDRSLCTLETFAREVLPQLRSWERR